MNNSSDDSNKPADTFCIYPFLELNISPSGITKPCCIFQPIEKDGRPMSVNEHSVEEIWNSDNLRSIRQSMVEGKRVESCSGCYKKESLGTPSLRTEGNLAREAGWLNPRYETLEQMKARAIENTFSLPGGPEWLNLELGNLCNLKCRMCHQRSSSGIANDQVQSRWNFWDYSEIMPRWQGSFKSIAPFQTDGVDYTGLLPASLVESQEKPAMWMSSLDASFRVARELLEADTDAFQIKLKAGATQPDQIEIFANEVSVYRGAYSSVELDFDLPQSMLKEDELVIRILSPVPIGIEQLKLLRKRPLEDSVRMTRSGSGKPWFQDEDFLFNDLLLNLDHISKINLMGGEPFLIKEVVSILKYLISKGVASNITLSMTTNATVANEELCTLCEQFKAVIFAISLDGVGALNDYIRFPSKWNSIEPNIKRLQQVKNGFVYAHMTVQAYNMLHVAELARYCLDMEMHFRYFLLQTPLNLSCYTMPIEVRREAARRISAFAFGLTDLSDQNSRILELKNTLFSLVGFLESNDNPIHPELLNQFMLFTNDLDSSRGEDLASVNKELVDFIVKSGVPWNEKTHFAGWTK